MRARSKGPSIHPGHLGCCGFAASKHFDWVNSSGTRPNSYDASASRDSVTRTPVSRSARASTAAFRSTSGALSSYSPQGSGGGPRPAAGGSGRRAWSPRATWGSRTSSAIRRPRTSGRGRWACLRSWSAPRPCRPARAPPRTPPRGPAPSRSRGRASSRLFPPDTGSARDVGLVPVVVALMRLVRVDQPGHPSPCRTAPPPSRRAPHAGSTPVPA